MIIELPGFVTPEVTARIREAVKPFLPANAHHVFNRDGRTVNITRTPELAGLDDEVSKIFQSVQQTVIRHRYRPPQPSADSGYEYHMYAPGEVCHHHADNEFGSSLAGETLLRYASVTLHLNTVHEGGELVFPAQNKSVKTEEGKVVIFPPYGMYSHYTTPSEENREVIVTWFVYSNLIVRPK
jgi:hypothetical protein